MRCEAGRGRAPGTCLCRAATDLWLWENEGVEDIRSCDAMVFMRCWRCTVQNAGLDRWEMVSSASRLYDWQASRLGSPHLGAPLRTDSSTSQPDTLRKRE